MLAGYMATVVGGHSAEICFGFNFFFHFFFLRIAAEVFFLRCGHNPEGSSSVVWSSLHAQNQKKGERQKSWYVMMVRDDVQNG